MKAKILLVLMSAVLLIGGNALADPGDFDGPYPLHGVTPDVANWWATYVVGSSGQSPPGNILGPVDGSWAIGSGQAGYITVGFDEAITNGAGVDFAVWENGFKVGGGGRIYAELGYVDVSTDGTNWVEFPSTYLEVGSGVPNIDPTYVYNLAGNYEAHYMPIEDREGTPFNLDDILNTSEVLAGLVDPNEISYVRLRDIIGGGEGGDNWDQAMYFGYDRDHLICDGGSYGGGADWDAIGVMNAVPIPGAVWLLGSGLLGLIGIRRKNVLDR